MSILVVFKIVAFHYTKFLNKICRNALEFICRRLRININFQKPTTNLKKTQSLLTTWTILFVLWVIYTKHRYEISYLDATWGMFRLCTSLGLAVNISETWNFMDILVMINLHLYFIGTCVLLLNILTDMIDRKTTKFINRLSNRISSRISTIRKSLVLGHLNPNIDKIEDALEEMDDTQLGELAFHMNQMILRRDSGHSPTHEIVELKAMIKYLTPGELEQIKISITNQEIRHTETPNELNEFRRIFEEESSTTSNEQDTCSEFHLLNYMALTQEDG